MTDKNLRQINSPYGLVTSVHGGASQAGVRLLEQGGNAVDAACATLLALCVTAPQACGLGGYGGNMVVHLAPSGKTYAVDFDGIAPAAAHERLFPTEPTDSRKGLNEGEYHCTVKDNANMFGPLAIIVPGSISGAGKAHAAFGKKPWKDVVAPALELAEKGFVVSDRLAEQIRQTVEDASNRADLVSIWAPTGKAPEQGEVICCPAIARSLRAISDKGWEYFYRGQIGKDVARHVQNAGGIMTEEDMAVYEAKIEEPYSIRYRDREVFCAGLPNAGLSSLQILGIFERFDFSGWDLQHPDFLRLFVETSRLIWLDRLENFGDPDFVPVDQRKYISDEYTSMQAEQVHRAASTGPAAPPQPESCTTSFAVVDREHSLVSCTFTNGGGFGSRVAEPYWGVALAHGMSRFDPRPGHANSVGPRKRPLSNMGPLIILRDGKPMAAICTPGGRSIISTSVHFTVGLVDFGLSIGEAMQGPRCHATHESALDLNETYSEETIQAMENLGYRVNNTATQAVFASGITVNPDGTHSASNGWACSDLPVAERE